MATYIVSKNTTGTYTNTGYTDVQDTQLRELDPTTNYATNATMEAVAWAVGDSVTFVTRFNDISSIGAGTVTNAEVGFWIEANGNNIDYDIHEILRNFIDSQATWNVYSSGNNWQTAGGLGSLDIDTTPSASESNPSSGNWIVFNGSAINALVESWCGGSANNGFLVKPRAFSPTNNGCFIRVTSSEGTNGNRPYLKFDHTSSGVSGSASVTTSDDSSSASGSTTVTGSTALTTIGDSSTASGTTTVVGSLNVTTANDTSSANGSPIVNGTIAVTTGDDTSTASGSVGGAVDGTANITTQDDTSNTSGTTTILGVASSVTSDDTSNASGSTTVVGSASVTTGDDTSSANGSAGTPTGTASITTGNDICTAFGIVPQENLFGGVAHFKKLSERSRKLRELEAQERTEEPTSEDIAEVVQIPQEVKEIISNVSKIDNEKKQRAQLKAQLKALEIQFKQEYSDALKTEMIRQYLIIEQERQEEEETISMLMMALV